MDHTKLIRDAEVVHAQLVEMSDGSVVTKKGCKIYTPQRYSERQLAEVGIRTRVIGIFAITVQDSHYAVCNVNAVVELKPSSTNHVRIAGEEYYEFVFDPGAVVIASTDLVKTDVLVYRIYDELISKGNVPWFFSYEDFGSIFDTARYHANANIGNSPEVTELIISLITRDPKDRTKSYRSTLNARSDLKTNPPLYIPLKSIGAATNTTNRLAGSYFSVGVSSALVSPAERTEKIEEILRK